MTVPAIDTKAVWQLWGVLQERQAIKDELQKSFENKPHNFSDDAQQWVSSYKQGAYLPLPKSLTPSLCPPALAKSASIAFALLQQLLDQGLTPAGLKDLYNQHHHDVSAQWNHNIYDLSDGFDFWTIAQHETDHCLRSFVVALSAAAQLSDSELAAIGKELDAITDRFPIRPMQVDVTIGDLESLLSLPVWEKRFDLYSAWIATEIIRALKEHDVEIHHDHGRISFAFKETTLATIHSSPGPFKLISERRTPLANPRGEGRKGGVQPDYGLWSTKDAKEVCKMVVEVKHYKNSSKSKFVAVFEDYARALPDGDIYLVNHGPVGAAVNDVSSTVQDRCKAIGHLTSSNIESREILASAVRKCVGKPILRWPDFKQPLNPSKVLLIDISGSMKATLQSAPMHLFLRSLAVKELPAKLVAADQKIVGAWNVGEAGFEELLRLEGSNTDLGGPVSELLKNHEFVLVISDKDGVATIRGVKVTPCSTQATPPPGIEVRVCRKW